MHLTSREANVQFKCRSTAKMTTMATMTTFIVDREKAEKGSKNEKHKITNMYILAKEGHLNYSYKNCF